MKRIRMPKKIADAWLAALRSGEYVQGRFKLQTCDNKFCCLGVLEHVVDGNVERDEDGYIGFAPSPEWLKEHDIRFLDHAGIPACNPCIEKTGRGLIHINDETNTKFAQIADLIETELEYTDDGLQS